jgi:predicted extracellular nuclease
MRNAIALATVLAAAGVAQANIYITEWAYSAGTGEYFELTNTGNAPVDLTGWSYDDDSNTPGSFDLSSFGVVAAGESIVITEATEADFRSFWSLPAQVRILGGNTHNLSRNDIINIYDAAAAQVDRLAFGDQNFPGTIRTQNRGGVPSTLTALGANDVTLWNFADSLSGGGVYDLSGIAGPGGVLVSNAADTGNPGYFIPTPGSIMLAGVALFAGTRRRR